MTRPSRTRCGAPGTRCLSASKTQASSRSLRTARAGQGCHSSRSSSAPHQVRLVRNAPLGPLLANPGHNGARAGRKRGGASPRRPSNSQPTLLAAQKPRLPGRKCCSRRQKSRRLPGALDAPSRTVRSVPLAVPAGVSNSQPRANSSHFGPEFNIRTPSHTTIWVLTRSPVRSCR
jgi:hypothetical protein